MGIQFKPQLNGSSTQALDCGVMSTNHAIQGATTLQGDPQRSPSRAKIRDWMGIADNEGSNVHDWERALKVQSGNLKGTPFEAIPYKRVMGGSIDGVKNAMRNEWDIITGVHYGELRRAAPGLTGSERFDGWHAIYLRDLTDGKLKVFDSLNDGRYSGCPNGPVTYGDPSKVWSAMKSYGEAVTGKRSAVYLKVRHATKSETPPTEPPEPPPPPVDPCAALRAEVYAELEQFYNAMLEVLGPDDPAIEAARMALLGEHPPDASAEPAEGLTV